MQIKSNEVKTTSDRVLSAAEKCPTAKDVLKELFPEVFQDNYYKVLVPTSSSCYLTPDGVLQRRSGGKYAGAIFLSTGYTWSVEKDDHNSMVLVGRPKY